MTLLTKRLNAVVNFVFSSFKEINNVFSHINRNGFGVKSFGIPRTTLCINKKPSVSGPIHSNAPGNADLLIQSKTWISTVPRMSIFGAGLISSRTGIQFVFRLWGEATIPVLWIATIKVNVFVCPRMSGIHWHCWNVPAPRLVTGLAP